MPEKKIKGKLAARFRLINILLVVSILIITITVNSIMIFNFVVNTAKDNVRLLTMESVDILNTHLKKEITLTKQASNSKEIIEWYEDENNLEKKQKAFHKLMVYADLLEAKKLHLGLYESKNQYIVDAGVSINELIPFEENPVLERFEESGDINDQWFFDAIDSEHTYILKLDTTDSYDEYYIFIDHKVTNNGKILGTFSSSLAFENLFQELFAPDRYEAQNVIGLIIDNKGLIQMDSRHSDAQALVGESTVYNVNEMQHIRDFRNDEIFLNAVNEYLDNMILFSEERIMPDIIRLKEGEFEFMSIAPIPNTNWAKITFYDMNSLFDINRVLPLVIMVFASFAFYVILISFLIQRIVFKPLNNLTISVSHPDHNPEKIFGLNRDDEIGELAKTTKDSWIRLNENTDQLMAINQAASLLLDTEFQKFEDNLIEGMRMMTQAVNADRVYILKNHTENGELCFTQIYYWESERAPKLISEYTDSVSYKKCMPDWYEKLSKGECVNCLTKDMSDVTRKFLEDQKILSAFAAPIFVRNEFWGFVGFDDCTKERIFSETAEAILKSGCLMIGNAFLRNDMTKNLQTNISQLKALQKELESALEKTEAASKSKSIFLANMSHEIRTPMNGIIGFSELALDDDLLPKTKNYLIRILENSKWLLQIINDILDLSKIESGKMELENIPFDLHEMFTACRTVIHPIAFEKGLELYFYAEPSTGKVILGDPTRLRQVLVNLLSNAVKFTNSGIIKMLSAVKKINNNSVTMSFEVRDSGIGITPDQMNKIFEPFMQGDTGTTRKYGGTGLGLPITKNIIELMGGTLQIESTPGVGSKFYFELTFDAKDANELDLQKEDPNLNILEKPRFDGVILLCEDNEMNQQVIQDHITRVGLKTILAENGKIALDIVKEKIMENEKTGLQTKPFDLIFMDIHMPVMDGLESAKEIMKLTKDIPIVALTANVMSDDRSLYVSAGFDGFLGKPFTSQELWHCLSKYFTPLEYNAVNLSTQEKKDNELKQKLINQFVKSNENKFNEIETAIKNKDYILAHRLAHTLKSTSELVEKSSLSEAAKNLEITLMNETEIEINKTSLNAQLRTLEQELKKALDELIPLVSNNIDQKSSSENFYFNSEEALNLLNELEKHLNTGNFESLKYIDKLYNIPGAKPLQALIEDFDFSNARKTLIELRKQIEK